MNQIMQRPLFRQTGGPAQPMAQDMQAPIQQAEAEGEAIGQEVATRTMDNIDSATDVKSAIDALRGNAAPLEARYQELAGFVGERDAAQTPESVLALTQPAIMMTEQGALDSGIGELMQKLEGNTPMTQGMDSGLGALMMQGAGNTPPQNFRQGGPVVVQGFQTGGIAEGAAAYMPQFQELYASVLGDQASRDAELAERKKMTKAQMLFDLAQAGLAFAGETQGSSVAERLANATSRTQLFDKLGTRAAGQLEAKQALGKEKQQMDLAALQSSIAAASSDAQAEAALAKARATVTAPKNIRLGEGDILVDPQGKVIARGNEKNEILTLGEGQIAYGEDGSEIARGPAKQKAYTLSAGQTVFGADGEVIASKPDTYQLPEGSIVVDAKGNIIAQGNKKPAKTHLLGKDQILVDSNGNTIAKGTETKQTVTVGTGQQVIDVNTNEVIAEGRPKFENVTFYKISEGKLLSETVNVGTEEGFEEATRLMDQGYVSNDMEARAFIDQKNEENRYQRDRADQIADFDKQVNAEIDKENRELNRTLDTEERAMLYFEKRLLLQQIADVDAEERALDRELRKEERANIEARARLNLQEEMKIRAELRALKNRDNIEVREVDGQLVVFDKTKPDQEPTVVFGEASVPDPEYRAFSLEQNGKVIQVVEDINTIAGKALLAKVNEQQAAGKDSNMQRISTAITRPQGYLIPEKGVFMSYDGGKTYVDDEGVRQNMPGTAQSVSDTISYEVHKTERLRANAIKALEELDSELIAGGDFTEDEQRLVRNAYESARKGTGLWSKVIAGIDALVGGVTGKKVAVETQDARQFVRMVRILGRSALSVSPKFPQGELIQNQTLFPNEETLIANPQTEARKLLLLKKEINLEKTRILSKIASGDPISKTDMATFNQKLFEIDRLNKMLGPIDTIFSNVGTNEVNPEAQRIFDEALQKGQGSAGDRAGVNN